MTCSPFFFISDSMFSIASKAKIIRPTFVKKRKYVATLSRKNQQQSTQLQSDAAISRLMSNSNTTSTVFVITQPSTQRITNSTNANKALFASFSSPFLSYGALVMHVHIPPLKTHSPISTHMGDPAPPFISTTPPHRSDHERAPRSDERRRKKQLDPQLHTSVIIPCVID